MTQYAVARATVVARAPPPLPPPPPPLSVSCCQWIDLKVIWIAIMLEFLIVCCLFILKKICKMQIFGHVYFEDRRRCYILQISLLIQNTTFKGCTSYRRHLNGCLHLGLVRGVQQLTPRLIVMEMCFPVFDLHVIPKCIKIMLKG